MLRTTRLQCHPERSEGSLQSVLTERCFASLNMTGVGRVGKRLKLDGGALLDGAIGNALLDGRDYQMSNE